MEQVALFERVHPNAVGVFLFDNAPLHCKMVGDELNANKMDVGKGGKQPVMSDTIWVVRYRKWWMKMVLQRCEGCVERMWGGNCRNESERNVEVIKNIPRF